MYFFSNSVEWNEGIGFRLCAESEKNKQTKLTTSEMALDEGGLADTTVTDKKQLESRDILLLLRCLLYGMSEQRDSAKKVSKVYKKNHAKNTRLRAPHGLCHVATGRHEIA
jgi:hypothetical protein